MSEAAELLPLGSAVQITDDDAIYVIIARGFQKHIDGFLAGYKVVVHPQGAATGVREIVIRGTQIVKVIHRGYEDARDTTFAAAQLENAKTPEKPAMPAPEPDLTAGLTKPATTTSPISTEPPGADRVASVIMPVVVSVPTDPFKELRMKGKRL